jgi:predicted negative regulator of RcsB-dependent stress response
MSTQSFTTWIRHPGSIVLIIAVVLMFVVMNDRSRQPSGAISVGQQAAMKAPGAGPSSISSANNTAPGMGKPKMGGELPRLVQQLGAPSAAVKPAGAPGRLQAPDLGSLLGRLEDKVKSDPANIGNRLLLAQTYNELGLGDKAVSEVRAALVQAPDDARSQLVLASILSARQDEAGLNEAKTLLNGLKPNVKVKQYLVSMYLGDTFIRLGDHEAALENWKQALKLMPATDNRRPQIEKRIADLAANLPTT